MTNIDAKVGKIFNIVFLAVIAVAMLVVVISRACVKEAGLSRERAALQERITNDFLTLKPGDYIEFDGRIRMVHSVRSDSILLFEPDVAAFPRPIEGVVKRTTNIVRRTDQAQWKLYDERYHGIPSP